MEPLTATQLDQVGEGMAISTWCLDLYHLYRLVPVKGVWREIGEENIGDIPPNESPPK